ncbi:hypothetical protein AB205_0018470, partial [Aquarana catesbeiana]
MSHRRVPALQSGTQAFLNLRLLPVVDSPRSTDFDGPTVGLAFVGTICSDSHSCGVIQDHSRVAISVGATVAHEMGHNLGMNHDTGSCTCSADSCIMSPTLSYNTPHVFSSCSLTNFREFIYDRMPACMQTEPLKEFIESPSVCGNKFTEMGEDCDCGNVKECTNPCCDAATCKFKNKAQCSDGECCENCKIKKAGIVCRPVKDECDLADMCDGKNPKCPSDRFIFNGQPCNDGQGFCYNGTCPSLEGQDLKCGVLYCSGGSKDPKINAAVATISTCKGVLHSEGMVKNGTMCGEGM